MDFKAWKHHRALIETARELRKNMTKAEKILWNALRDRRFKNVKFRRQVVIERFIVDFLCMPPNLVIEVDGGIHDEQREHDKEREEYLQERHYRILRIRNEEIEEDLNAVLEHIEQELQTVHSTNKTTNIPPKTQSPPSPEPQLERWQ